MEDYRRQALAFIVMSYLIFRLASFCGGIWKVWLSGLPFIQEWTATSVSNWVLRII